MTTATSESVRSKKKKIVIVAIFCFAVILLVFGLLLFTIHPSKESSELSQLSPALNQGQSGISSTPVNSASSQQIVYGTWSNGQSFINSLELNTGKISLIATLPINIKKISVLSPTTILYIDQTDSQDHGKQLAIYDIKQKRVTATIQAADGFGIDDYVLSPNKQYIATWEVAFASGSHVLQGGKSRVYAVNLVNPEQKNLIYDETASTASPVHYPRAVVDNGRVFSDRFLPNDPNGGTGWAYGMSVSDFSGTTKQDLTQMQNGTYGTQPALSPDGRYLAFAGYDGSRGPGTNISSGYRQALLTPDTVELLNTTTLERQTLPNLPSTDTYSQVNWDKQSGALILTVLSSKESDLGIYSYSIQAHKAVKLDLPDTGTSVASVLSILSAQQLLIGLPDSSDSSLGNLGESYAPSLQEMDIRDLASGVSKRLQLPESYVQYISILPAGYFPSVLGTATNTQHGNPVPSGIIDEYSGLNSNKNNLQLYTFFVKSSLLQTRIAQQSNPTATGASVTPNPGGALPVCKTLSNAQCAAQGLTPGTQLYGRCVDHTINGNTSSSGGSSSGSQVCSDSPLYLYGKQGQQVHVSIQTPVSNEVPFYPENGYTITLGMNGDMVIGGQTYQRISYDYLSGARRIVPPLYGVAIDHRGLFEVLQNYATRLGLNEKETHDLLSFAQTRITSPYVFTSFFDEDASEQILPLSFSPKPDTYRNIVFYFRQLDKLPNIMPAPPVFGPPLHRDGLTAVEVSEIIE